MRHERKFGLCQLHVSMETALPKSQSAGIVQVHSVVEKRVLDSVCTWEWWCCTWGHCSWRSTGEFVIMLCVCVCVWELHAGWMYTTTVALISILAISFPPFLDQHSLIMPRSFFFFPNLNSPQAHEEHEASAHTVLFNNNDRTAGCVYAVRAIWKDKN